MVEMALQEVVANGLLVGAQADTNGAVIPEKSQDFEDGISHGDDKSSVNQPAKVDSSLYLVDLMEDSNQTSDKEDPSSPNLSDGTNTADSDDNGVSRNVPNFDNHKVEIAATLLKRMENLVKDQTEHYDLLLDGLLLVDETDTATDSLSPDLSTTSNISTSSANWNGEEDNLNQNEMPHSEIKTCFNKDIIESDSLDVKTDIQIAEEDCQDILQNAEDHDYLKHPNYLASLKNLEESRLLVSKMEEKVKDLEARLSFESSQGERITLLEQRITQQERELQLSKQEHDLDTRTITNLKREMDVKLETLRKQYDQANREKEAMVMRYAVSEKELIDHKKGKEVLDKKLKEALKENENILGKLKLISSEKAKMGQLLDNKSTDLSLASKEIERLKEEINSRDIKIKWIQNKVKTEIDLHKDCPSKIESLTQKVHQLGEQLESAKKENENHSKEWQEYQQNKSFEQQLKEEQAKLILERHEHGERETKLKILQAKNQSLIEENTSLSLQVESLEQDRFENERKLMKALEEVKNSTGLINELRAETVDLGNLTDQLQKEQNKAQEISEELEKLRKSNEELVNDMAACRSHEAEMLSFTQKLTSKNVQLQSEFSAMEAKAEYLDSEYQIAEDTMNELRKRVLQLEKEVKAEQSRRQEESRLLARQVAERAARAEALEAALADHKGEISVMKNKHASSIKELQRELHQYRKKLEQPESGPGASSGSDSLCHGSRTSSLSSLNENQTTTHPHTTFQVDVPPQALVDRIVRLQHEIARQKERIEFLEDHSSQLVAELQKKSRLLQSYILREESGALTSRSMDSNKAEVTRHGGIMASVYGSKPADDGMTLELSLEINHKLQAILEDTLLKNITLKENIDTLGDEIARLTQRKV